MILTTTRRGDRCCWPPHSPGWGSATPAVTCPTACPIPCREWCGGTRRRGTRPTKPMVPHGMSVILNAPAVFRFTAPSSPQRHLHAARLMGADTSTVGMEDAGELLADTIISLIRQIDVPNGLGAVGYTKDDVDDLVAGALPQDRVIKLSPRPVDEADLRQLFLDSLTLW